MPKRSSSGTIPSWAKLFELASAQAGYVTNGEAGAAGYSLRLLQFYVNKGRLERAGRGILRLVHFPVSEAEDLVPLWLWSKREGVFSHETALMLHNLSDALPAKRYMTVPRAWDHRRLRLPRGLSLQFRDVPKASRTWIGAVPVTTPLRTVVDCAIDRVQPDLVEQAIAQGVKRRLFSKSDVKMLIKRQIAA
jgi:predicted transcriptional regulator of viral defense system